MKKTILAILVLTLSACGGNKDRPSESGVATNENPQVSVPADALFTDYSCDRLEEFSLNAGPIQTSTWNYGGVSRSWQESGLEVSFDEDADGSYKMLSRVNIEILANGQRHSINNTTEWQKKDGIWQKTQKNIESLYYYEAGVKKYIYRRVDGRDSPSAWESQTADLGPKSYRIYSRHLSPPSLNRDGRVYSRVEETCTYTDR